MLIGAIGCIFIALSGVFVRLWYLQVVQAEEFLDRAARSGFSRLDVMAPRGLMYDRKNRLVAGVRSELVVTGVPAVVNKNIWVLDRLAQLTGADVEKLKKELKDGYLRPNLPAPIYVGVDVEVATKIAESGEFLPGIDVSNQPMRYYPNTVEMSHILGYVGTPSPKDLERIGEQLRGTDLTPAAYVGKDGLERTHERELMGQPGLENVVSAKKKAVRIVSKEEARPGNRLILTIDRELQKLANELLEQSCRAHKSDGGAVVMIEPTTGEILCMASRPTFDLSAFEGGVSKEDYEALLADPRKPLFNRTMAAYPPGSVFKIATAIAAAKAGIFNPGRTVNCPGYYELGRQKFRCENHGAGSLSFLTAFSKSCNTYFGSWAGAIGKDSMCQTLTDLGFGRQVFGSIRPNEPDLLGEAPGVVPTEEWLNRPKRGPREFFTGHLVQMGFGQGYVSTTPLQMASLVALVANEGKQYEPHLVKATVDRWGNVRQTKPVLARNFELPVSFWQTLKQGMVAVVNSGTAHRYGGISGVTWGGKTGSAEHLRGRRTHAWYVGVAPIDNPKVVIAVLVEQSGHGGDVAVPIAQRLVSAYLKESRALTSDSRADSANATSPTRR